MTSCRILFSLLLSPALKLSRFFFLIILESESLTMPAEEECPSLFNRISVLHNGSHPGCCKSPYSPCPAVSSCRILSVCLVCYGLFFSCKRETSEMCTITNTKQPVGSKNNIRSWCSCSHRAALAGKSHTRGCCTRLCLPRVQVTVLHSICT